VVFHAVIRRDDLVRPMITGWKRWRHEPLPQVEFASHWRALLGVALAASLVWWVL
jgi:hypothetical protein